MVDYKPTPARLNKGGYGWVGSEEAKHWLFSCQRYEAGLMTFQSAPRRGNSSVPSSAFITNFQQELIAVILGECLCNSLNILTGSSWTVSELEGLEKHSLLCLSLKCVGVVLGRPHFQLRAHPLA